MERKLKQLHLYQQNKHHPIKSLNIEKTMTYGDEIPISWLGQAEQCCEINRSMESNDDFSTNKYSFKCVTVTTVITI